MSSLQPKDHRLIDLVSCVTRGAWEDLKNLRLSAPQGEPDGEWREALLQSHLFLGVPRVVEAFEQLAAVGGLNEASTQEGAEASMEAWMPAGEELFGSIYADLAPTVQRRLRQHHPHFAQWILEHAYGRVLSRPGLDPARRELLALVCLSLSNLERQLASHTRGALRLGASREQILATIATQKPHLEPDTHARMLAVAERFSGPDSTSR